MALHQNDAVVRGRICAVGTGAKAKEVCNEEESIYEFTKIVVHGILHQNNHNRQPAQLTKEMIADQVEPTQMGI